MFMAFPSRRGPSARGETPSIPVIAGAYEIGRGKQQVPFPEGFSKSTRSRVAGSSGRPAASHRHVSPSV